MNERSPKRSFVARPADPESWIKAPEQQATRAADAAGFTARLTIDITPELRGRIKIVAFQRGVTVADMLRELLAREFPDPKGDAP
uniref:Plasmid segregation centromere-binding protein ParG n=1 Tax=Caulobacter sp. (strain K31) TaxID=366602 RepID=B0SV55_CAUSK